MIFHTTSTLEQGHKTEEKDFVVTFIFKSKKYILSNFYRTQASLVRSIGPDLCL